MKQLILAILAFVLAFHHVQAISLEFYLPQVDPLQDQYIQKYSAGSDAVENRMKWVNETDGQYCYNENGEKIFEDSSLLIIDVSKWQDTIDWEKVKDHIDGVIIRAGYGAQGVDEYFQYNIEECNRLEIPYGVYLYSYASDRNYAILEAQHLDELLSEVDLHLTLPIYYDIEEFRAYSDDHGNVVNPPTTVEGYEEVILSFIEEMNQLGYQGMVHVYSYQWYCENLLNSDKIRPYLTWYANYSSQTMTYDNSEYVYHMGWQYTSTGKIEGISTDVDISCFPDYILDFSPEIKRIVLNGEDILLPAGSEFQIEARVIPVICDEELTYISSNEKVAAVQDGMIQGISCGEATITVCSSNGVEASMQVHCYQPVVELQVSTSEITITDQEDYLLNVTVLPLDATNQEITYQSMDPEVVQVDSGVIHPISCGDGEILVSADSLSTLVNVHVVDSFIFEDVDHNKWYYPYVYQIFHLGLMKGTTSMTFDPSASITRGQLATILYRMAGENEVRENESFKDVAQDKYYSKAVAWCKENGIVTGYNDESFRPSQSITRQELAVMLRRYAGFCGIENNLDKSMLDEFPDTSDVSKWAKEAVNWAVENGLISGDQGKLNPKNTATRAQCAKMILALKELISDSSAK